MHELPKDLNNSLRSWRGSVRRTSSVADLEKGLEYDGAAHNSDDKAGAEDKQLNAKGSIITHASVSSDGIHEHAPTQRDGSQPTQRVQLSALQTSHGQQPASQGSDKPRKQATFPPQTPASAKKSIFSGAPKIMDPDPVAQRLSHDDTPLTTAQFYDLIGIRPPTHAHQHPRDLLIKGGLYYRITRQMDHIQLQYRVFDIMTYVLLFVQLLLSAIFTVLGALGNVQTHLAIAILGGVAVVVAGALALMKGQGLPNRLRRFRDGLRAVAFEAEELYWDVAADKVVYFRDIKKVREDYLRIMDVAERNHPDTWNSFTDSVTKIRRVAATAAAPASGSGSGSVAQKEDL